jgi:hypothetical protein
MILTSFTSSTQLLDCSSLTLLLRAFIVPPDRVVDFIVLTTISVYVVKSSDYVCKQCHNRLGSRCKTHLFFIKRSPLLHA